MSGLMILLGFSCYYLYIYAFHVKPLQQALIAQKAMLEVLYGMSYKFHETYGFEGAVDRVLTEIITVIEAEGGSLFLIDPTGEKFVCVSAVGFGASNVEGLEVPRGAGFLGHSLSERRPVVVNDVGKAEGHFALADEKTGIATRNLVAVPLFAGDQPVGGLELVNKKGSEGFKSEDVRLLESLANLAGLVIRNLEQKRKSA